MCRNPNGIQKISFKKAFCIWVLLSSCFLTKAQVFFSNDPHYLKQKKESNNQLGRFIPNYPDTSINNFHNVISRNFMGNVGLPIPEYLLGFERDDLGFRLNRSPYSTLFNDQSVFYFKSKGPFANLTASAGAKQLQLFRFLFTQTFKNNLNIALNFNRVTSEGFYLNQKSSNTHFYLSSNYCNHLKRLGFYLYLLNNANRNSENGGIRDGVLTDSTVFINKSLFQVNLSNASRDNRELKLMLNPWIRLNRVKDSVPSVSHILSLKSTLTNASLRYRDLNMVKDNFYRFVFLDTTKTIDSTHVFKFGNELNYAIQNADSSFSISGSYKHELNKVWQHFDSLFSNQILMGSIAYNRKVYRDSVEKREINSFLSAQYVLSGPNKGNYLLQGQTQIWLNKQHSQQVFFNSLTEQRSADFIYNVWVSNHFKWFNNGFKPSQKLQAQVILAMGHSFKTSLLYQNLFNYLYFDNNAMPAQYKHPIDNLALNITLEKVFFKHLGISFQHTYQMSSKPTYIRMPQNITLAQLYYKGLLFKNNLQLQFGAQAQVFQSFFAYNYMPSTQAFYLQERATTAACPFVDVYLNARIHPVSFFFKLENVLAGLFGNNYSFVPGYYQPERAFRFGLNWMFFD